MGLIRIFITFSEKLQNFLNILAVSGWLVVPDAGPRVLLMSLQEFASLFDSRSMFDLEAGGGLHSEQLV